MITLNNSALYTSLVGIIIFLTKKKKNDLLQIHINISRPFWI